MKLEEVLMIVRRSPNFDIGIKSDKYPLNGMCVELFDKEDLLSENWILIPKEEELLEIYLEKIF